MHRIKSRAFTLLEVLVVMSIIAVLAALLLPILSRTRATARQVQCISNLRQWGVALELYMGDYQGYIPRRGQGVREVARVDRDEDWFNALPPYMDQPRYRELVAANKAPRPGENSIFVCPEAEDPGGKYFLSYAMNMRLSPWDMLDPDNINNIPSPCHTVFLTDGPGQYSSAVPSPEPYSPLPRHNGQLNILFLDGSVRPYSGEYAGCFAEDPKHPDILWDPGY